MAYSFYPVNIPESDERYFHSTEFLRLRTEINTKRKQLNNSWEALLKELKYKTKSIVDDIPPHLNERCFRGHVYVSYKSERPGIVQEKKIIFFVSRIIPYYSICLRENNFYNSKTTSSTKVTFKIAVEYHAIKDIVESLLNKYFIRYQLFPPKFNNIILPGIEVDGSSYENREISDQKELSMTLFQAYFTTNLI